MKKFKDNPIDPGIKPPGNHSIRHGPDEACRTLSADVLEILTTSIELEESCRQILSIVKTVTGCESAAIRFKHGNDYPYDVREVFSTDVAVFENSLVSHDPNGNHGGMEGGRMPKACFCGLVLSGKKDPLLTPGGSYWTNNSRLLKDLSPEDDPSSRSCCFCSNMTYSSVAVIPIRFRHDIIGLMHINGLHEGRFTDKIILCLEGIAIQIGLAWLWEQESTLPDEKRDNASETSHTMLTDPGQAPGCHDIHDISQICHHIIGRLRSLIPKNIDIIADIPQSGPMVQGSGDQIEQVLSNLVTNSWEAIGDGPGYINLSVKIVSHKDIPWQNRFPLDWEPRKKHYACLEVSDNGCGIDADDISRIFDLFFTCKAIGRGLGLPVVLGILRAHHGAITVESQSGCGSVFRFFLPVSPDGLPKHLKTLSPVFESDTGYTHSRWLKTSH